MSNSHSGHENPSHNSNLAPLSMVRGHSSFGKSDPQPKTPYSEMLCPLLLLPHQERSICDYLIPSRKLADNETPTKCLPC